jgi:hypothetical protein
MSNSAQTRPPLTIAEMDDLVDRHFRAEEAGNLDAIAVGFTPDAEHDVAGRHGGVLHGADQIVAFYRQLLADLEIERFATVRRWYGKDHVVDESMLHARAIGRPFGMEGNDKRVHVRLLHVFDFADGLISRESAWLDIATLQQQLAG